MHRSWIVLSVLALGACSSDEGGGGSLANGNGGNVNGGVADGGATSSGGQMPMGGNNGPTNGGTTPDGGATGASSGDNTNDPKVCEKIQVKANEAIPEMLIVLDKSGSMVEQGVDRWEPSVQAINTIAGELQAEVRFGLMFFPGEPEGGLFGSTCTPGFMSVEPAFDAADAIASALASESADGAATPIAGTLREARAYLDRPVDSGETLPPRYILLVTDGAPNCLVDGSAQPLLPTQDFFDQCQQDSYAEVDALREAGIPTYVIGYDTAGTPDLAEILDNMASRGGTGDTQHRPVENGDSLLATIESITGDIASCAYELEEAPGNPDYIRVTLDGVDQARGEDGWELTGETTIELRGAACELLQDKKQHDLSIVVECEPVEIL